MRFGLLLDMGNLTTDCPIVALLRRAMRTERGVRLAVLFGSYARGDQRADSDLDLMVQLTDSSKLTRLDLAGRLSGRLEIDTQVVHLSQVSKTPSLCSEIARDGRAIVDRNSIWEQLRNEWLGRSRDDKNLAVDVAGGFSKLLEGSSRLPGGSEQCHSERSEESGFEL